MDYAHEGHNVHLVVYHVVYHLVWCPKRRRKVLVGPIRSRWSRSSARWRRNTCARRPLQGGV